MSSSDLLSTRSGAGAASLRPVLRILRGIVIAAVLAAPTASLAAKAELELKIATLAPEGSTWMNLMHELDERVRAETANAVGLKFYPGGIQGDEPVVLRKIRTGQLHGAGFTGVGLGEITPSLRVMELPFLFRSHDEVVAVHEQLDPTFEASLQTAGFTLLGWAEVGFVYLYSKEPIRSAEDLRNRKVWLWEGDPLAEAFLSAAGVSPVPLPITDVVTSLQTGLISSVYVSPLACIALQWFTRVQYTTDLPIAHAIGAVVVANEAWAKVPEAHRATVLELCRETFAKLRDATQKESAASTGVIAENGVQSLTPDPAAVESLRRLGEDVAVRLTGKLYDQALLDRVRQALAAHRAAKP
jgi:TRAP-type C4-dicarboxylate transport system substrate-binding protein